MIMTRLRQIVNAMTVDDPVKLGVWVSAVMELTQSARDIPV